MNWPKRIVLVRHGESEGNVGHLGGDDFITNKPNHLFALSERGREQAQSTGEYLRKEYGNFDAYFVSTFQRTRETMNIMYPEVSPIIDSRLNEHWRGIWHSMPGDRATLSYPHEAAIRDREGWYHNRPPGGQNGQDVEMGIYSFNLELRLAYSEKTVLVVTHGSWLLFYRRVMLNQTAAEIEERYRTGRYHNCSVTVYSPQNGAMVSERDDFVP